MEFAVAVLGLLLAVIAVLFEPAEFRRQVAKWAPRTRKSRTPKPAPITVQPAAAKPAPVATKPAPSVTKVPAHMRRPRRSGWVHGWRDDPGGVRITVLGGDPRTEAWARRVFGGW